MPQTGDSRGGVVRATRAARFRAQRTAVLAVTFACAVMFAFDGWRDRGAAGALFGVLGAVIAAPLVLGGLWLFYRRGRDRNRSGGGA